PGGGIVMESDFVVDHSQCAWRVNLDWPHALAVAGRRAPTFPYLARALGQDTMGLRSRLTGWRKTGGHAAQTPPVVTAQAFAGPGEVGPTEDLVDVMAFVGGAVVLDNGSFVR